MHIERYGSGPQIFFGLHGWNGGHHTFLPLVDDLPPHITFFAPDLPGCGQSPRAADWTLETVTADIAHGLELSTTSPVTLVGNCSGAILALLLAQAFPRQVSRIVMIDAFADWPWYFRVFLSPHIGRYAYLSTFANPLGRWLTNASLRGKRQRDTDFTRGFRHTDHESMYRFLEMLADVGPAAQFSNLSLPIDILYGENSFSAVRESAAKWAGMWPQARTFELRGAGHLPIVEAAPQVKQILFGEEPCTTQKLSRSLNFAL